MPTLSHDDTACLIICLLLPPPPFTAAVAIAAAAAAAQLRKAILLEGSPGVGKTSLVAALARAAQQRLVRINCSEHTDLADLLGADLPAAGVTAGQFAWCGFRMASRAKRVSEKHVPAVSLAYTHLGTNIVRQMQPCM